MISLNHADDELQSAGKSNLPLLINKNSSYEMAEFRLKSVKFIGNCGV
jgi:hypothetical protein